MASPSSTPDTPITLKVNFNGVTRRYKVPLRELTVTHLEDKLRSFLQIPVGCHATVERYSDSAATYVLLDRRNISVYKQLYRAAKAKQKLKLRVSTTEVSYDPQPPTKPSTVQEVQKSEVNIAPAPALPSFVQNSPPSIPLPPGLSDANLPSSIDAPQTPEGFPQFIEQWRARGMPRIHVRRNDEGREIIDFAGPVSSNKNTHSEPVDTSAAPSTKSYEASLLDQARLLSPTVEPREQKEPEVQKEEEITAEIDSSCPKRPFTVACNSCDRPVPDAHFHCSTCDDGDFDLCQKCVNKGITCHDDHHWLIRRTISNGDIRYSTTQIAPKKTPKPAVEPRAIPSALPIRLADDLPRFLARPLSPLPLEPEPCSAARTCNNCIQELPEIEFVHCTTCADFDLCTTCFGNNRHGHHPKHAFTAAVSGATLEQSILSRMPAGRNTMHNAICDGCDRYVRGIRHKCLDCPDWDYCSDCMQNATFVHPNHRFVPVFEPLANPNSSARKPTHFGIRCDGPLCAIRGESKDISGERYKCAVCHDTDFCASCEASPANTHNKTHPLIKFKTPVRHVSVTTTGEHENGRRLPPMGDRASLCPAMNRLSGKTSPPREVFAATPVQTVVDVQPTEPQVPEPVKVEEPAQEEITLDETAKEAAVEESVEQAPLEEKPTAGTSDMVAIFQRDTVADGTVMPPNHTFEQTWVLRNEGNTPWPAGCTVRFVGGDFMGAIDPTHPAGIHELVSVSESTVCYNSLNPGQEFPFTVLMRTPDRDGRVISYWRLTTSSGVKFGHKLWCDVVVSKPPTATESVEEPSTSATPSQMIIPTLEHESPMSSMHEESHRSDNDAQTETETETVDQSVQDDEDFEVCGEAESWAEESDDEAFLTDEEYDILDASDEEYLSEQQKKLPKK